ncbi:hypothetical protein Dimus_026094, partial [Dionaea muscipula]
RSTQEDDHEIGLTRKNGAAEIEPAESSGTVDEPTTAEKTSETEQTGGTVDEPDAHTGSPQQQIAANDPVATIDTPIGRFKPWKHQSSHPIDQILTDIDTGVQTRSSLRNFCAFASFLSYIEPKNYLIALQDPDWVL